MIFINSNKNTRIASPEEYKAAVKLLSNFNSKIFSEKSISEIKIYGGYFQDRSLIVETNDKQKHLLKIVNNIWSQNIASEEKSFESRHLDATLDFMKYLSDKAGKAAQPYQVQSAISPLRYLQRVPREIEDVDMPSKWRNSFFYVSSHPNMGNVVHLLEGGKEYIPEISDKKPFNETVDGLLKSMASCVAAFHKAGMDYQKEKPASVLFKSNKGIRTFGLSRNESDLAANFQKKISSLNEELKNKLGIGQTLDEIMKNDSLTETLRASLEAKLNNLLIKELQTISEAFEGKLDDVIGRGDIKQALRMADGLVEKSSYGDIRLYDIQNLEKIYALKQSLELKDNPVFKALKQVAEISKSASIYSNLPKGLMLNYDMNRGNFMWHQASPEEVPELRLVNLTGVSASKDTPLVTDVEKLLNDNALCINETGKKCLDPEKSKAILDSYDRVRPLSNAEVEGLFIGMELQDAKNLVESLTNQIKEFDGLGETFYNRGFRGCSVLRDSESVNDIAQFVDKTPVAKWLDEVRVARGASLSQSVSSQLKASENIGLSLPR